MSQFGGFGGQIEDEIRRLQIVQGEVDNVVSATIQTIAEDFLAAVSSPEVWPIYATDGPRPPSLRKDKVVPNYATTPVRRKQKHSINRWGKRRIPGGWAVFQPAIYASFIHDNKPQGNLVARQVAPVLVEIEALGTDLINGHLLRLFGVD